jgi:hypothetical protein
MATFLAHVADAREYLMRLIALEHSSYPGARHEPL